MVAIVADTHFCEREEAIFAIERLIELLEKEKPDHIIHCGDGIDKQVLSAFDVFHYRQYLASINATIYHLLGNHDWGNESIPNLTAILHGLPNVKIIDKPELIKIEDYSFVFIPYPSPLKTSLLSPKEIASIIEETAKEKLKEVKNNPILITHWLIHNSQLESNYRYLEYEIPFILEYKYIFAGHVHRPQSFRNVIIPGSIYPLRHQDYLFEPRIIFLEDGKIRYVKLPVLKHKLIISINDSSDLKNLAGLPKNSSVIIRSKREIKESDIKSYFEGEFKIEVEQKPIEFKPTAEFEKIISQLNYDNQMHEKLIGLYNRYSKDIPPLNFNYRPIRIHARNYKQFETIDFDYDCFGQLNTIIGENASGKSNFADIERFAIFGKTSKGEQLENIIKNGTTYCSIDFTFTIDGNEYRIKRELERGKSQTVVLLQNEKPIAKGKKCQEIIEKLVDPDIFLLTYSPQDELARLLDMRPAELKDYLIRLLGLERYQKIYELANRDLNQMRNQLLEITASLNTLKNLDEEREINIEVLEKRLKEICERIEIEKQIEQEYLKNEERKAKSRILTQEIQKLKNSLGSYEVDPKKIEELKNQLEQITVEFDYENYLKIQREQYEITKNIRILQEKEKEINKAKEFLRKLNCDRRDCPFLQDAFSLCEKEKEVKTKIEGLKGREQELASILVDLEKEKKKADERRAEAERIKNELILLEKKKSQYELLKEQIDKREKELATISAEIKDIPKPNLTPLLEEKADIEKQLLKDKQVLEIRKKIAEKEEEKRNLETEIYFYTEFVKLVHRDGIPLKILTEALPLIERTANDLLMNFDISIILKTEENSIQIKFMDQNGIHPIESVSGFQKNIIGFALRLALIITLSQLFDIKKIYRFVIDEGLGSFSQENQEKLAAYLQSTKFPIERLILITHTPMKVGKIIHIKNGEILI